MSGTAKGLTILTLRKCFHGIFKSYIKKYTCVIPFKNIFVSVCPMVVFFRQIFYKLLHEASFQFENNSYMSYIMKLRFKSGVFPTALKINFILIKN